MHETDGRQGCAAPVGQVWRCAGTAARQFGMPFALEHGSADWEAAGCSTDAFSWISQLDKDKEVARMLDASLQAHAD